MQKIAAAQALGVTMLIFAPFAIAQPQGVPDVPEEELPAGSEVLARGPVHEAFAKPVTMDAQAPDTVSQPPPENIQEIPPTEKPAGADVVWVPGYWAWDTDRNDFIWVSGCWRNAPPNTYWVSGYWMRSGTGWQWIAGFWKPVTAQAQAQEQLEYLPAPPQTLEVEAPGPPPFPDRIWVPGCWYWMDGRYVARHGYWITPRVGWVWIPSHYAWTPRGYIFAPGHWDYDLDRRGVLFTPAYFPPTVRIQAGFVFSPGICVDLGMLRLNLFAYPRYHHYCFGDYYDDSYLRIGIYPWYRCRTVHTWYDPIYFHDRWRHRRTQPDWDRRQEREFEFRREHREYRPAHTYAELRVQTERLPADRRPERPLAQPLRTFASSRSTPVKFERINSAERQRFASRATEVSSFRQQRDRWESPTSPAGATENRRAPETSTRRESPPTAPATPTPSRTPPSRIESQPSTEDRSERPRPTRTQPSETRPEPSPSNRTPQPETPTAPTPSVERERPGDRLESERQPPGRLRSPRDQSAPSTSVQPQPSQTPTAPATPARPQPSVETPPVPARTEPGPPGRREATPSRAETPRPARQPERAPAPEVRVTRPEQVPVPTRPLSPSPGSRSVGRDVPRRPAQENYRPDANQGPKATPSQGKGQRKDDSHGRDRKP
jgi:hypothetical protein